MDVNSENAFSKSTSTFGQFPAKLSSSGCFMVLKQMTWSGIQDAEPEVL